MFTCYVTSLLTVLLSFPAAGSRRERKGEGKEEVEYDCHPRSNSRIFAGPRTTGGGIAAGAEKTA